MSRRRKENGEGDEGDAAARCALTDLPSSYHSRIYNPRQVGAGKAPVIGLVEVGIRTLDPGF